MANTIKLPLFSVIFSIALVACGGAATVDPSAPQGSAGTAGAAGTLSVAAGGAGGSAGSSVVSTAGSAGSVENGGSAGAGGAVPTEDDGTCCVPGGDCMKGFPTCDCICSPDKDHPDMGVRWCMCN